MMGDSYSIEVFGIRGGGIEDPWFGLPLGVGLGVFLVFGYIGLAWRMGQDLIFVIRGSEGVGTYQRGEFDGGSQVFPTKVVLLREPKELRLKQGDVICLPEEVNYYVMMRWSLMFDAGGIHQKLVQRGFYHPNYFFRYMTDWPERNKVLVFEVFREVERGGKEQEDLRMLVKKARKKEDEPLWYHQLLRRSPKSGYRFWARPQRKGKGGI